MNLFKANHIQLFFKERWQQLYVLVMMIVVTFVVNPSISYAATDKGNCTETSFNVPEWIFKAKGLIEEPVTWLQWISGILLPLLLIMALMKIKNSKGRTERVEEGMKMIYIVVGTDIAIFGVTLLAGWVLGKLC